jgi:hypothetical protein
MPSKVENPILKHKGKLDRIIEEASGVEEANHRRIYYRNGTTPS